MGDEQISETWALMTCVHDSLPDLMISMMSVRFMADDSACRLLRTITKVVLRRTTTARPLLCSRFFFYSFDTQSICRLIRGIANFIGLIRYFCSEEFLWINWIHVLCLWTFFSSRFGRVQRILIEARYEEEKRDTAMR